MEAAARGEYVARTFRDFDLLEAGGVPKCLALIGGVDATKPEGAATVAIWLYQLSAQHGFREVAQRLFNSSGRGYAGSPFPTISRTRAGLALARQLIQSAAAQAIQPSKEIAPFPFIGDDAPAIGLWLAVLIEVAGLSEAAAVLWDNRLTTQTPKARPHHSGVVSQVVRSTSAAALQPEDVGNPR